MKKYTLLIVTMTLCCIATQCVYAVPSEVDTLDSDIIDSESGSEALEDYEILETGQATIKFIANPEEDNAPVSGVVVELYYKVKGQMQNVNSLDEFSDIVFNFVSDANGEVLFSNLPYGMYEYVITSLPYGMEMTTNNVKFEVTPFDNAAYEESYLIIKTELAENTEQENINVDNNENKVEENTVDSNESNSNDSNTQITEASSQVVIEQINIASQSEDEVEQQEENTITQTISAEVYDTAKESFKPETTVSEDDEEVQTITSLTKKKFEYSKKVLIQSLKDAKITDAIRVAITSYDKAVYQIKHLDKVPDEDRNKKIITRNRATGYVVAKRMGSNGNFSESNDTRLAVLPSVS